MATWCEELTHLKRPWCWGRLKVGGEGDDKGWDSWKASPAWRTWVWVGSGSWWWTGKPDVMQSVASLRVGHDWVAEVNWYQMEMIPLPSFQGIMKLSRDKECKSTLEIVKFIANVYCLWNYTPNFKLLKNKDYFSVHSKNILTLQLFKNIFFIWKPTQDHFYISWKKVQHISLTPQISQMENCHFASLFSMLKLFFKCSKWLIYA